MKKDVTIRVVFSVFLTLTIIFFLCMLGFGKLIRSLVQTCYNYKGATKFSMTRHLRHNQRGPGSAVHRQRPSYSLQGLVQEPHRVQLLVGRSARSRGARVAVCNLHVLRRGRDGEEKSVRDAHTEGVQRAGRDVSQLCSRAIRARMQVSPGLYWHNINIIRLVVILFKNV